MRVVATARPGALAATTTVASTPSFSDPADGTGFSCELTAQLRGPWRSGSRAPLRALRAHHRARCRMPAALAIPFVAPLLPLFRLRAAGRKVDGEERFGALLSFLSFRGTEASATLRGLGRYAPRDVGGCRMATRVPELAPVEPRFAFRDTSWWVPAGKASSQPGSGLGRSRSCFVNDGWAPSSGRLRMDEFRRVLRSACQRRELFPGFRRPLFSNVSLVISAPRSCAFNLVFQINGISFLPAFGLLPPARFWWSGDRGEKR